MMVMPGMKLAHPPTPLTWVLFPQAAALGRRSTVCTRGRDRSKKGSTKKKEMSHPRNQTRPGTHPIAELPLGPLGHARLVPKKQNRTYIHEPTYHANPIPMRRRSVLCVPTYVGLRLRWRRHRCREHRLWCARILGRRGRGGVRVD